MRFSYFFLVFKAWTLNSDASIAFISLCTLTFAVISSFNLEIVNITLGLRSKPKTWPLWILLVGFLLGLSKVIPI